MKKNKYKKETLDSIKFIGILIAIFIVFKLVFAFIPPFNDYSVFAIQTDSMDPIIAVGDIVIVKEINSEDIEVGDIMAFSVDITGDGEDDVVVHYIAEIDTFNDELVFNTKPHVSDLQDSWTIEERDLIGIYKYQVNGIGKVLLFAQSWVGIVFILVDIIIISIAYDMLFGKINKNKKKKDIEEISNE